jgi:hypothetical protein
MTGMGAFWPEAEWLLSDEGQKKRTFVKRM